MGSVGQGAVVCAAAVDAAIDAMVVNVARRFEVWWPLVLWRAMAFNFLNVGRCGGVGGDGGRRLWQWGLDEMVVNVARRSEVRWPLVLRRAMAFYLNVGRRGGAGGDGGQRLWQWALGKE